MYKLKLAAMIGLLSLTCTLRSRAAEIQPIHWVVAEGMEVDKEQATRIYDAACAWIEDHFSSSRTPVQPKLTIHIGEMCPDSELGGACFSSATSELYLPRWEETSPSAVAHATLIAGLLQLLDRDQMRRTVARLLEQEARDFVSARTSSFPRDVQNK